jgi:hypothetical protein
MNGQKIIQTQKPRSKDWEDTKVLPHSSVKPGIYYLDSAQPADRTLAWDGQFVHKDKKFLYQQCGMRLVKHELNAFANLPAEGSVGQVRYQKGKASVESLKSVRKLKL